MNDPLPLASATATKPDWFRWAQLAIGVVCMAMIANLQYGWTLFVDPIDAKYHWGRPAIQLAFTIFVITEPGSFRSKPGSSIDMDRASSFSSAPA